MSVLIGYLMTKRQAWGLTRLGWLLVVLVVSLALFFAKGSASYLAVNHPIWGEVLIVEGWLPDYALKGARDEFARGGYRYLITSGGPIPKGHHAAQRNTYAELAAATLIHLGVSSNAVVAVSSPMVGRNRTHTSAEVVKDWIIANDPAVEKVMIYSLGVHARRSWFLYKKAFGKQVEIGVRNHPSYAYDVDQWWASSVGVRSVTSEVLGCLWIGLRGVF